MAETFRKRRIEDFLERLNVRESILRKQLLRKEFAANEQFLQGQLSAVDAIIQELATEFDLDSGRFGERAVAEFTEREWLHEAARSPSFAFLLDPAEDIYSLKDGKPVAHRRPPAAASRHSASMRVCSRLS